MFVDPVNRQSKKRENEEYKIMIRGNHMEWEMMRYKNRLHIERKTKEKKHYTFTKVSGKGATKT